MRTISTAAALVGLVLMAPVAAQTKSTGKAILNDVTVRASDGTVYVGTMELAVTKGKVSGDLHVTKPVEIKGKVAGTAERGVIKLAFPYVMTTQNCEGSVKMELMIPQKAGPLTGTMEAVGCGRDETRKLTGTVELVPVKK